MRFVLASGNRQKLREFAAILAPYEVLAMPAGVTLPPEGSESFEANALRKARTLAAALVADPRLLPTPAPGRPGRARTPTGETYDALCLADDSGLEVEALGWGPGVVSSRYAGDDASDEANYRKLLSQLEGVGEGHRRARFVCVAAAIVPAGACLDENRAQPAMGEYLARGEWWGGITWQPHGTGGFGYDPVFMPEGSDLTVAELPREAKDQASHRALAGRALLDLLKQEGLLESDERRKSRPSTGA